MAISREEIEEIAKKIADQVEHELGRRSSLVPSTLEEGGISDAKLQELIDEVPDVDDPSAINYWKRLNNEVIYLEGWSDKCLAGTGFPPMEDGETGRKIAYIEDLTPGILERKARAKENPWGIELKLVKGGFLELEDAVYLYGVTYGIYARAERGIEWPEPLW